MARRRSSSNGRARLSYSSSAAALPRPHESVRQVYSGADFGDFLDPGTGYRAVNLFGQTWPEEARFQYRRKRSLTLPLAEPSEARDTSQRYLPLRLLEIRLPAKVRFCVQRQQRRQVLFAKGRAGYRGSAKKRFWRRTANSQWRC